MSAFGYAWRIALISLALAALVPTRTGSLGPHPNPTHDYETAMKLAASFQRGDSVAAPGGASLLLTHGRKTPRAIVLFHGITNSPQQFSILAAALFGAGDNVFVPRLPQQATRGGNAHTLGEVRADALRDAGDASIDIATGLGDTVVVLGLSLGGDIAAWAAQFRPEVDRAVVVAPALGIAKIAAPFQAPVTNLALRLPSYTRYEEPDTLRPDRTLGWSTRGAAEMFHLGEAVARAASGHAPAAREISVLVNGHDHTVSRAMIDELSRRWTASGGRVAVYELPDSLGLPHDTVDPEQMSGNVAITYPVLISLVYGTVPPGPTRKIVP